MTFKTKEKMSHGIGYRNGLIEEYVVTVCLKNICMFFQMILKSFPQKCYSPNILSLNLSFVYH